MLTCYNALTGEMTYEQEMENTHNSSPALAGDKIYLFDLKGKMQVIESGPAFKELNRGDLGEMVETSPAFTDGKMFIRGKKNLFCIGTTPTI